VKTPFPLISGTRRNPALGRHRPEQYLACGVRGRVRGAGDEATGRGIWLVSFTRKISDKSIWRRGPRKPSTIRSARACHLCL